MKKITFFFYLIVVQLLAYAQTTYTLTVMEEETMQYIPDVIVSVDGQNMLFITDASGTTTFLSDGIPSFSVSHIGFSLSSLPTFTKETEQHYRVMITMRKKNTIFQPVTITASRAGYDAPITYTNISGETLNKNNFGEDMPMLLEFTPSAVVTSDAGNGVGYTGIRIRGSDATRINVTINGVPYNDAESQQTYWVDLPDFASSVDDIQIQRGVGTSANGISSFGGAINIQTNQLSNKPFASASFAAGSFNLLKASASFGTGKIKEHWYMEGRISKITSDGYIDRSFADLTSFFMTGAYQSDHYVSAVNIFSGEEHTYQSWGGVPKDSLEINRTFNLYTYENQTDNYTQTHYQWHQSFYLERSGLIKFSLNYTKGAGYYEQLEEEQLFSDYGIPNVITGSDTIYAADFITQQWLDNDYYGAYIYYANDLADGKLHLNAGGAWYQYAGEHFGKVIWSEYATTMGTNFEWYRNDALKDDGNLFTQMTYDISDKFKAFIDLQVRNVQYKFTGYDFNELGDIVLLDQSVDIWFFNPKAGITYHINPRQSFYMSGAKSGKEPNRSDYVESSSLSRPKPEIMYDVEAGHKLRWKGWEVQSNIYWMYYIDQLVLNGEINDVGAYTRINVPESYRAGIEVAWAKTFFDKLNWNANFSLSRNEIVAYTEFVDNWDTGEQIGESYEHTTLAFSPSVVAANLIEFTLLQKSHPQKQSTNNLTAAWQTKYVGRQYIDNTSSVERSLDPYCINDVSLNYTVSNKFVKSLNLRFAVQNIFDHQYESNAWVYRYIYEGVEGELNGYFPQAGRNYTVSINMHF